MREQLAEFQANQPNPMELLSKWANDATAKTPPSTTPAIAAQAQKKGHGKKHH